MITMNNEETFRFIELYQAENCLWNPKNKDHKNKNIVNDSWKRIADTMGIPVHELKKKKESLMTYFRSNLKKKLSSMKSGAGEDDAYKPIWIFYDAMEVFLKDIYECNSILNSEPDDGPAGSKEDTSVTELDSGESSIGVETSDAGNVTSLTQKKTLLTNSQVVQKRRAKNPQELQEAGKQMSAAFNTLNKVLQAKNNKEDDVADDSDLFCKLLAKQLKDFPKEERDEIIYEIHGLVIRKRHRCRERVLQHSPSSTFVYSSSPSAHSSSYSNESLPIRNITSPDSPSPTLNSHTSPSQMIISRPSSSLSSYSTPTLPQNIYQGTAHQATAIDGQPIPYSSSSPSQIIISRPSSSLSSYSTPTLSQNINQGTAHQAIPVDGQPILYSSTSPSQIIIRHPSSSRSSYITPAALPKNFNEETLNNSHYDSKTEPANNVLLEAYEKAMEEQK